MNLKKLIQRVRHLIQIIFFLFFVYFVVGAVCSFIVGDIQLVEPLGALQIIVASRVSIPQTILITFLAAAAILIGVTILLGRAWCAWACPIGSLTELIEHVMTEVKFKPLVERRPKAEAEVRRFWGRGAKFSTLAAVMLASAATKTPAWCSFCPIGTICRGSVAGGFVAGAEMAIVGGVLAANTYEKLFFCKYICPVAGLLTLISRLNPLIKPRVKLDECRRCAACAIICPWGLLVCEEKSFAECTKCFVCYSKCPYGVITISPYKTR
jgi:ferredoxin-type protein NapH